MDFDPNNGTDILSSTVNNISFILKLDVSEIFISVQPLKAVLRSIVTGQHETVYGTGSFRDSVDFDPGKAESILTSYGSEDIFIYKSGQAVDELRVYPNPTKGVFAIDLPNPRKNIQNQPPRSKLTGYEAHIPTLIMQNTKIHNTNPAASCEEFFRLKFIRTSETLYIFKAAPRSTTASTYRVWPMAFIILRSSMIREPL